MYNEYNKNCYSEKGLCMNMKEVRRLMSEERRWEEERRHMKTKETMYN